MSPALAATGADTRCDPSAEAPQLPEAMPGTLTIEVVEHSSASPVTPGQLSLDGSTDEGGSGLEADPGPPQVETLLRRIFDERQLRAPDPAEDDEPDTRTAPMAIDKSEAAEPPGSGAAKSKIDSAAPRIPGISGDDLVRFKRQMYRTDI